MKIFNKNLQEKDYLKKKKTKINDTDKVNIKRLKIEKIN